MLPGFVYEGAPEYMCSPVFECFLRPFTEHIQHVPTTVATVVAKFHTMQMWIELKCTATYT